jgi:hypothetical protein
MLLASFMNRTLVAGSFGRPNTATGYLKRDKVLTGFFGYTVFPALVKP